MSEKKPNNNVGQHRLNEKEKSWFQCYPFISFETVFTLGKFSESWHLLFCIKKQEIIKTHTLVQTVVVSFFKRKRKSIDIKVVFIKSPSYVCIRLQ